MEDGFIDLLTGPKKAEFALLTVAVFIVDIPEGVYYHYYEALSCLAQAMSSPWIKN